MRLISSRLSSALYVGGLLLLQAWAAEDMARVVAFTSLLVPLPAAAVLNPSKDITVVLLGSVLLLIAELNVAAELAI